MKLMTYKLQPWPCKVPKTLSVGCGGYLIILLLHGTSVSHGCLFKIYVTVAGINWAVFQSKFKLNLIQYYIFHKNSLMWYRTLNGNLMSYSLSSWM